MVELVRSRRKTCIAYQGIVATAIGLGLLLIPPHARALDPKLRLHQAVQSNWSMNEGLPQLTGQAIEQTKEGYLWFGTQEGLARFDGYSFKVYDKSNSKEFTFDDIKCLELARDGTLWVGTQGGGLVSMRDGRFRAYTPKEGLAGSIVSRIIESRRHGLVIATEKGVSIFKDGVFSNFGPNQGLRSNLVKDVVEDREGRIWIGTGKGLNRFEDGALYSGDEHGDYTDAEIFSLLVDSHNVLWIGTNGKGLFRYDRGEFKVFGALHGINAPTITHLLEDRSKNLWIATYGDGICRLRGEKFDCSTKEHGLPDDEVHSLFEDAEGSLWAGFHSKGFCQFRDPKFITYSVADGLPRPNVRTLLQDTSGAMWLGFQPQGVGRYRDGQFEMIGDDRGMPISAPHSLFEDSKGRIWLGTYSDGIYRSNNGRFEKPEVLSGLPTGSIRAILEDKHGSIWFGVFNNGVYRYKEGEDGPTLEHFTQKTDGLALDMTTVMAEDSRGAIWIGSWGGGVTRYRGGAFEAINEKTHGLKHKIIISYLEDREGRIWLGTHGGGLVLFGEDGVKAIGLQEGLFDDTIFSILEDDLGYLWMSCNKGIFRVKRQRLLDFADGKISRVESEAYDETDGMKVRECNGGSQPSGLVSQDGVLWFPTADGVTSIDPKNMTLNKTLPPILLQKVVVDGVTVSSDGDLEIAPGAEQFEFHYTSPTYISNDKILFHYKLEGFDHDWIDAGHRRAAYYTNLNPGSYRFVLKARNADGFWSEDTGLLTVELKPEFWQTAWFRALSVLGFLLLVAGSVHLRLRAVQRQNALLEQKVEERTKQLEAAHAKIVEFEKQALETQMAGGFAHEIRNSLAGAKMLLSQMLGYPDKNSSFTDEIGDSLLQLFEQLADHTDPKALKNSAPLIRSVNHSLKKAEKVFDATRKAIETSLNTTNMILEYSKIHNSSRGFDLIDVDTILQQVVEDHRARAAKIGVTMQTRLESGAKLIGRTVHIESVIGNLLQNSLDSLEEKSSVENRQKVELSVESSHDDSTLTILVEDTGMGIPPKDRARIFEPFFSTKPQTGTGLGLNMVMKYVKMYDGTISFESEPGEWTRFQLIFPLDLENNTSLLPSDLREKHRQATNNGRLG